MNHKIIKKTIKSYFIKKTKKQRNKEDKVIKKKRVKYKEISEA